MNQEQWIKWEPIEDLNKTYEVANVNNSAQGFTILMEGTKAKKKIKICFTESIAAYRYVSLVSKLSSESLRGNWSFFKIINSSYLQWLSDESSGFFHMPYYTHFVFLGENSIIDVAANYEPTIIFE